MKNSISRFIVVFAGLTICANTSIATTYYEWQNNGAISVNITSPASETYVPINMFTELHATANDPDCERRKQDSDPWTDWYAINDDVSSGDTVNNYHIWWTCTGDGEILDGYEYGPMSYYESPDYSAGNNVRAIDIVAHADDFDRGNENPTNKGYKESAGSNSICLNVWQITVETQQSGTTSTNYDGPAMPESRGDTELGWITPCTLDNKAGYYGNTQIKGSIPSGPNVKTGYCWFQDSWSYARYKVQGNSNWVYDIGPQTEWTEDMLPDYARKDEDSRHPNGSGIDVREIFALDAPGFYAGYTDATRIDAPDNWTDYELDANLKAYVYLGPVRVSNEHIWATDFVLDVDENTQTWIPVGNHTP